MIGLLRDEAGGMDTLTRRSVEKDGPVPRPGSVVLLRAVNVGGHQVVRIKDLPGKLAVYDAVNVGAAGSFVVRGAVDPNRLRTAFRAALGFDTDIIVRSTLELAEIRRRAARVWPDPEPEVKRFITFVAEAPPRSLPFPWHAPSLDAWEVRLDGRVGLDVLSSWRPRGERRMFYANAVVEKASGARATTRGWETIERLWAVAEAEPEAPETRRKRGNR